MRLATIAFCILGGLIWLAAAAATFLSGSDPATRGLDVIAGVAATILFALTSVPAAVLVAAGRSPRLAFAIALVFPLGLAALFVAAMILAA